MGFQSQFPSPEVAYDWTARIMLDGILSSRAVGATQSTPAISTVPALIPARGITSIPQYRIHRTNQSRRGNFAQPMQASVNCPRYISRVI